MATGARIGVGIGGVRSQVLELQPGVQAESSLGKGRRRMRWQWQLLDDSLRDGEGPVQWPGQKVLQDHALEGRRRVRVVVMVINMVVQRSDRPLLVEGVEGDVFPHLFHGPPPRCLRDEDRSVRGRGRPGGGGGGRQHPVVATVTVSVGAALVLMAVVGLLQGPHGRPHEVCGGLREKRRGLLTLFL